MLNAEGGKWRQTFPICIKPKSMANRGKCTCKVPKVGLKVQESDDAFPKKETTDEGMSKSKLTNEKG